MTALGLSLHLSRHNTWAVLTLGPSAFDRQQSVLYVEHKPDKLHFEWVSLRESAVATMRQCHGVIGMHCSSWAKEEPRSGSTFIKHVVNKNPL